MSRAHRLILIVLVVALLASSTGCVSFGSTSYRYFNWAGRTFSENPASVGPFMIGLILFFIAGIPLDLISWPITALAYADEEKRQGPEEYYACAFSPSFILGTSGGVLLGAIFYPFGWPFMSSEPQSWDETPAEEGPLKPPPGGNAPPAGTHPPGKPGGGDDKKDDAPAKPNKE